MDAHTHDDHHTAEQKPVAFTVPFILAAVVILITVLFLSLCDPKPHHASSHDAAATEHAAGAPAESSHDDAAAGPTEEPIAAPTGKEH